MAPSRLTQLERGACSAMQAARALGAPDLRRCTSAVYRASAGEALRPGFGRVHTQPALRRCAMAGASKRVLVPIGNGSEEMEAVVIIDVLRRAGVEVQCRHARLEQMAKAA